MKHLVCRFGGPTLLIGCLALLLTFGSVSRASAADTNTIQSITSSASRQVEITLTSTKQFDVRDDILTLQIGLAKFTLSGYPPDGDLNTIIFTLTPTQFAATKTGDPVSVYFDSSTQTGVDAWSFGTLNKSMMKSVQSKAPSQIQN